MTRDTTELRTFRSRAVSRTVEPAREAAEARVQRFLDSALELMQVHGDDFTIQNLVEHSGQSLRSFYHHFAGKYELLVAVFEEGIRHCAVYLEGRIEDEPDPLGRLEAFVTEYYRLCRGNASAEGAELPSRAFGKLAHQLLYDHPDEAARAFTPLVSALRGLLDGAAAAGAIDDGLDRDQVAGAVLQAIMFNAFATTITGATSDASVDRGDLLWRLLIHGLAGQPNDAPDPGNETS